MGKNESKGKSKRGMVRLMDRKKLMTKAVTTFNKWVRERDKGKGCISCGTGPVDHAGHYFSAGHYSSLKFSEMNCNGQCISCNTFKHGNLIGYRQGLVKRYGEGNVKLFENTANLRSIKKWTVFELELIIKEYARPDKTNW